MCGADIDTGRDPKPFWDAVGVMSAGKPCKPGREPDPEPLTVEGGNGVALTLESDEELRARPPGRRVCAARLGVDEEGGGVLARFTAVGTAPGLEGLIEVHTRREPFSRFLGQRSCHRISIRIGQRGQIGR